MYQSVIFDLDGTLVNSLYHLAGSMNRALVVYGLPAHPGISYKQFVGNGRAQLVRRAIGAERLSEQLVEKVTQFFNQDYAVHCMDQTKPYDGILPMLCSLQEKGVQIGVLSNKPDAFVQEMIKKLFPGVSFSAVWGKREGFAPKPDCASVYAMLKELGCEKQACLYVGDSDVDVYLARDAALAFCGVQWGFRGEQELLAAGAQATVQTPEDLLQFIVNGW